MGRQRQQNDDERFIDVRFPLAGVDLSMGFLRQPNRPIMGGEYARTCAEGTNVRSFDNIQFRCRGGSRPGMVKFIAGGLPAPIQDLAIVSILASEALPDYPDTGGGDGG